MVILEKKERGTKYPEFRLCRKSLYKKERENKKKMLGNFLTSLANITKNYIYLIKILNVITCIKL